jgi:hypothetical protein
LFSEIPPLARNHWDPYFTDRTLDKIIRQIHNKVHRYILISKVAKQESCFNSSFGYELYYTIEGVALKKNKSYICAKGEAVCIVCLIVRIVAVAAAPLSVGEHQKPGSASPRGGIVTSSLHRALG